MFAENVKNITRLAIVRHFLKMLWGTKGVQKHSLLNETKESSVDGLSMIS